MCTDLQYMANDNTLFAKHKLDTNQPRVTKRLHDTARKILGLGSYDLLTGTTPVPSRTTFKPGGVLALACGPVRGRIMERGTDPLGRWIYLKLRRNTGPPITVIVTYQVVDVDPHTSGLTTYATQLYASYIRQQRLAPHNLIHHLSNDLVKFV